MTDPSNSRPIGTTPVTDAAAATAPSGTGNASDTTYPVDAPKVASNADLRVSENKDQSEAAVSPTGIDIDNDHADERPINRSKDSPENTSQYSQDEQFTPVE